MPFVADLRRPRSQKTVLWYIARAFCETPSELLIRCFSGGLYDLTKRGDYTTFRLTCYTRRQKNLIIPSLKVKPADFSENIPEHVTRTKDFGSHIGVRTIHHSHRQLKVNLSF